MKSLEENFPLTNQKQTENQNFLPSNKIKMIMKKCPPSISIKILNITNVSSDSE